MTISETPPLTMSARWRALIAAITAISLVGVGLSAILPLLSIDMERRAISSVITGFHIGAQAIASMATAFLLPPFLARHGTRALLISGIVLCLATIAGFALIKNIWVWFLLRALLGTGLTLLFSVSENWITQSTQPHRRGLVMGIYASVLSLGFAAGPWLLTHTGTQGHAPYMAAGLVFVVGLLPVWLGGSVMPRPAPTQRHSLPVQQAIARAPVAAFAALTFGAIETAGFAFLSIWALRNGLTEPAASLLLTLTGLGNVLFQIPLGLLADRMSKQLILLICASISMLGTLLLPVLLHAPMALHTTLLVWGGLSAGLYTIGLAHLGERFDETDLPSANSAFVMMYSLGMLLGPPLVGFSMEKINPDGFVFALSAIAGSYVLLLVINFARRS